MTMRMKCLRGGFTACKGYGWTQSEVRAVFFPCEHNGCRIGGGGAGTGSARVNTYCNFASDVEAAEVYGDEDHLHFEGRKATARVELCDGFGESAPVVNRGEGGLGMVDAPEWHDEDLLLFQRMSSLG